MKYSFNIIGVSPVLSFFNHQLESQNENSYSGAEYVGAYRCTLDAFLDSLTGVPRKRGWDLDQAVDTVVQFWLQHGSQIQHWRQRLDDAGDTNIVVGRLATLNSLRSEFESLFNTTEHP